MRLAFVALAVLALAQVCAGQLQSVSVFDSNIYWTEYNWYKSVSTVPTNNYVQTANSGAYFKVSFTGTSFGLTLDTNNNPTSDFMTLRYSVDSNPYSEFTLPAKAGGAGYASYSVADASKPNIVTLVLVSGLAQATHTIYFYVRNSQQLVDRWTSTNHIRINAILLDVSAVLSAYTPSLYSKRMLVFGDSITEGVRTLGSTINPFSYSDLTDNDAGQSWAFSLAEAAQTEVSLVGFGSQGFTRLGAGGVPPFFTPGDDANSAWNKFDASHSRLVNGKFSPAPDYIVVALGTTDKFNTNLQAVHDSINGAIAALRTAAGKDTIIVGVVPFGQQIASDITAGYGDYFSTHRKDKRTYLVDNGVKGSQGISIFTKSTPFSADGLHPLGFRSSQLGSMLAGNLVRTLLGINDDDDSN